MSDADGRSNEAIPENAQDLTVFVQNLLEQMVRKQHHKKNLLSHPLTHFTIYSNNALTKCQQQLSDEVCTVFNLYIKMNKFKIYYS